MKESTRLAKTIKCPYCGAQPGYGCFYYNRQGVKTRIIIHKARITESQRKEKANDQTTSPRPN